MTKSNKTAVQKLKAFYHEHKKAAAVVFCLISLVSVASNMSYYDEVEQHNKNCSNAIYKNDNPIKCEGNK